MKTLTDFEIQILDAAKLEFEQKGFYKTNVDDIAVHLGIGKGTIYRHFGNKFMLFITLVLYVYQQASKKVEKIAEIDDFRKALDFYIDQVIQLNLLTGQFVKSLMLEEDAVMREELVKDPQLKEIMQYFVSEKDRGVLLFKTILDWGIREGKILPKMDTLTCAEISLILINNYIRVFHSSCVINKELRLEKNVQELKNYIYRGICLNE